ncbi:MAG: hypothetical protein QM802_07480 [Agriterribacter sp.]
MADFYRLVKLEGLYFMYWCWMQCRRCCVFSPTTEAKRSQIELLQYKGLPTGQAGVATEA